VDEDVSAFREPDQVVRGKGVVRNDDRTVTRVKAIGEGRDNGRMVDEGHRHREILVLHDWATVAELVDVDEWQSGALSSSAIRVSMSQAFISKNSLVILSSVVGPIHPRRCAALGTTQAK
jgi:hypothetical protein